MCPDGALVDINLPGPDGFTLAAAPAALCPTAVIVLISAEAGCITERLLRDCGASAFVPKEDLAVIDLSGLFTPEGT
jgi:CheY-like chemotaxis protein